MVTKEEFKVLVKKTYDMWVSVDNKGTLTSLANELDVDQNYLSRWLIGKDIKDENTRGMSIDLVYEHLDSIFTKLSKK